MVNRVFRPLNHNVDPIPNWFSPFQQSPLYRIRRKFSRKEVRTNFHKKRFHESSHSRIGGYIHYMAYHSPTNVQKKWISAKKYWNQKDLLGQFTYRSMKQIG